jgi:hypothetical protein
MTTKRRLIITGLFLLLGLGASSARPALRAADQTLPPHLTDQEFWQLSSDISEPNGYFRSDNLLSNEIYFQHVIPDLVHGAGPGGAYLGVGPEQNFTYIAALRPDMVFIPDIRRGNLDLQLMYKALFELSSDRAQFVSRLFTKKRPESVDRNSTAEELFAAYSNVRTDAEETYRENLKAIDDVLVKQHALPLSNDDLSGINYVYSNFYKFGPDIDYNSSSQSGFGGGGFVTYAELMTATDGGNVSRSYLANEESFKVLKTLEEKNLIVPVVADLSGPKAVRAIGRYLKEHNATVTAFYLSNVEQYLNSGGSYTSFCRNVAALPLDTKSTFIRSTRSGGFGRGGLMSQLGAMQAETKACATPNH